MMMAEAPAQKSLERITLGSELAELSRVASWVEALATRYAIPEKTAFAINLCLEEALSNTIRHGYKSLPGKTAVVCFHREAGELLFTIEDEAPHFNPPNSTVPAPRSLEELTPGGLGIPLIRRFADRVEWQPLAKGNRLTLGFLFKAEPIV